MPPSGKGWQSPIWRIDSKKSLSSSESYEQHKIQINRQEAFSVKIKCSWV
jgi:hypothetical protein